MTTDAGARRAATLTSLGLVEQAPDERFDRIVRLAVRLMGMPMAMINLVGEHQWTKAEQGISGSATSLEDSICRHAVDAEETFVVPDLTQDARFVENVFVTEDPHLRFYAGEPLTAGGVAVGTLCVMDTAPRTLTADQREVLDELARWAESELSNAALNQLVARARAQERRLKGVLDASPDGVLLVGPDGGLTTTNAAAVRLLGRRRPEADRVEDVFPGLTTSAMPFGNRRRREADEPQDVRRVDATGVSADGARFPVQLSVGELADTAADRWVALVRDLRPVYDVDARIRTQERLTRLILASAGDGLVGLDREGHVTFTNRAATRLLRCRESDLVGRSLHEVAHHSHPDGTPYPAEDCPARHALDRGTTLAPYEDVFFRRDGVPVPVELSVAPITVGAEVEGGVVTVRDISERREVQRLKDEFVGVVSHELRTPLTSILGSLRLIEAGVVGPVTADQGPLLAMAVANAQRLGRLVDDILDLDRLDAGRMPLHPVELDAVDLVRGVVGALEPAAREAGVALGVDADALEGGAVVKVDPDRVAQALTNLVGNALKFTAAGGEVVVGITVQPTEAGGELRIAVRDTGTGIPAESLTTIFERFSQAGTGHDGERRGTGLGLSIAQGVVERSGGRLEVQSQVGVGSEFTVVLARVTSAAPSAVDARRTSSQGSAPSGHGGGTA